MSSLQEPKAGREKGRYYSAYMLLLSICGYGVYNLDKNIVSILIEPIKKEFLLSDFQISLLVGLAGSLPVAVACIPLGLLADRVSRVRMLIVVLVGWSLATGLSGFATTVLLLFLSRVLVGLFEAGFTPVSLSLISDTFPPRKRATAMGAFSLGAPLGVCLALVLGGAVAQSHGWRAAFFIAGAPGLLLALLMALTLREPVRGQFDVKDGSTSRPPFLAAVTNTWRDPVLRNLWTAMVCCVAVISTLSSWTPSFLIRSFGLDLRQAGFVAAIVVGGLGALGAATGGALADRLAGDDASKKLTVVIVGVVLSTTSGIAGFSLASSLTGAVILLAASAFFGQFFFGTGYSLVSTLSPPAMRATTVSVLLVSFNLLSVTGGGMFVGYVSDRLKHLGPNALAMGAASSYVFGVAGVFFFIRARALLRRAAA